MENKRLHVIPFIATNGETQFCLHFEGQMYGENLSASAFATWVEKSYEEHMKTEYKLEQSKEWFELEKKIIYMKHLQALSVLYTKVQELEEQQQRIQDMMNRSQTKK